MRNPKFRYVWKNEFSQKVVTKTYTLDEIEFCDGIPWMTYDTVGVLPSNQPEGKKWQLIARDLFTGRKDKNGTEVYEGDRIRFFDDDGPSEWVIKWEFGDFYMHSEARGADCFEDCDEGEVIGNIHQD